MVYGMVYMLIGIQLVKKSSKNNFMELTVYKVVYEKSGTHEIYEKAI